MIARITISSWDSAWKKISSDDYQKLAGLIGLPSEKPTDQYDNRLRVEKLLIDTDLIADILLAWGFSVEVEPVSAAGMLVKLKDKIAGLEGSISDLQRVHSGGMVQVHVADMGILMIDEVMVCDDYCTDALQKDLDNGWRILAVCPPNAQRRPDYIMGRRKR